MLVIHVRFKKDIIVHLKIWEPVFQVHNVSHVLTLIVMIVLIKTLVKVV